MLKNALQSAHFREVTLRVLALDVDGRTETNAGSMQLQSRGVNRNSKSKPYQRPDRQKRQVAAVLGSLHGAPLKTAWRDLADLSNTICMQCANKGLLAKVTPKCIKPFGKVKHEWSAVA